MGAEVRLRPGLNNEQIRDALRALESAMNAAVPELQYVYLEDHE
jgi:hypothetical protein